MTRRLKIYKNLIVGIDLLRRTLVTIKHFPTVKEAKDIIAEGDPYNEARFFQFSKHSHTNTDKINENLRKIKLHIDILFSYIHQYAINQIDRFIHSAVRIERINHRLNQAAIRASDWIRTVKDKSINFIARMDFFSSDYIVPGALSGVEIDHRMGWLKLIRKSARPIFLGDANLTYTNWGKESRISLVAGSLLSNVLNGNIDSYFGGEIRTDLDIGRVMFYLNMKKKERFNRVDIELIVPGAVRIYNRGKVIGDSTGRSEGLYHSFVFPYMVDDTLAVEVQTRYARIHNIQNVFDFAIRSIKLSVCIHAKSGYANLQPVVINEPTTADAIAVETKFNNVGKVTVDILQVLGESGTNMLPGEQPATINIGSRLPINNTELYGPVEINPPPSNLMAISNPHVYITADKYREPMYGTQLYSIPLSSLSTLISGSSASAIIPESIRIVPFLDTCIVQTFIQARTGDWSPSIDDWAQFSNALQGALTDNTLWYSKSTMTVQDALDPGIFTTSQQNTKIEFFIKALEDVRFTIKTNTITGLTASYYFDNQLIGHGPDIPIFIKEGGWHKFIICIYSSGVSSNLGDLFGQNSNSLIYLANIVNSHRIVISSLKTGELPYVDITDLPFAKGHRFSVDLNNNLLTTVNYNVGTMVITWKEMKGERIKSILTKINLSTDDIAITPSVDDVIVIVGNLEGRDPLIVPRK